MILTAPSIWRPELWLPEWMMATPGKRQKKPNGKRATGASGKVIKYLSGDEKCCCAGGCGDCGTDVAVTFSGIIKCICFLLTGVGYRISVIDDPNVTYTGFTSLGGAGPFDCRFSKIFPFQVGGYGASPPCDGDPGSGDDAVIQVLHHTATNKWWVTVGASDSHGGGGILFAGMESGNVGFGSSSVSIASERTICGFESTSITADTNFGYDGDVLLEFICA